VARYEHLPIYKKAMDLTIYFEKVVRNFSRYHKYTLGSELREKKAGSLGQRKGALQSVGYRCQHRWAERAFNAYCA
jgi:hypothetical protein